jgi:hypothetical protein
LNIRQKQYDQNKATHLSFRYKRAYEYPFNFIGPKVTVFPLLESLNALPGLSLVLFPLLDGDAAGGAGEGLRFTLDRLFKIGFDTLGLRAMTSS